MEFVPNHILIEKGSTVTWRICPDTSNSTFSGASARSHIILFDEILVESPKLELAGPGSRNRSETFSLNFQDIGIFKYGCCIYSRMRGRVEVIESKRRLMPFQYPWQQQ